MMKMLILFILFVFLGRNVFSQTLDDGLAKVFYTMQHKRDIHNKDSVYRENMILLVGKNASVFSSFDKIKQVVDIEKQSQEQRSKFTGAGRVALKPTGLKKIYTDEIFQCHVEHKRFIKEFLVRNYLYEELWENINWKLTSETKTFGKISAQKATATFKGRQWEAWFAPELPFETGPWKLHGLPGLIIEAYDITREIEFLFSGFESVMSSANQPGINNNDKTNAIALPKKVIKVSESEIKKLKDSMYKNPKGFTMAQLMATGGFADDANDMLGMSYKEINNPIELPAQ